MKKYARKARKELIKIHSVGNFVFEYNQIYSRLLNS